MSRNIRVLTLLLLALASLGLCKCGTWYWRSLAEKRCLVLYQALQSGWAYTDVNPSADSSSRKVANESLSFKEKTWAKFDELRTSICESVSRPFRKMDHTLTNTRENLPPYVNAAIEFQIAKIVDGLLYWVVFIIVVIRLLLWAAGHWIENWIERGKLSSSPSATCERLPNGDILVHAE